MVTFKDIQSARENLQGVVHRTPLDFSRTYSEMSGNRIFLKMENLQRTGSFKTRGAYNKIASLTEADRNKGVIAASAGNHAQGVAFGAGLAGIPATIVMPEGAPLAKITATKSYGAEIVLAGQDYDAAYAKAIELQRNSGAVFVHAFDDPHVVAGQGTVALEILDELADVDYIFVPIGGGGLASGVALAAKAIKPGIKIIGVEATGAASMQASQLDGQVLTLPTVSTIADGIAVKRPGILTFQLCQKYLDDIITVGDEEIANAILMLMERSKIIVEGAGATALAGVLENKLNLKGQTIVAVVSGGNIDVNFISRIIERGLSRAGRYMRLATTIDDRPGSLQSFLANISATRANIISVEHNRISPKLPLGRAEVVVVLETQSQSHIDTIVLGLTASGYEIEIIT